MPIHKAKLNRYICHEFKKQKYYELQHTRFRYQKIKSHS